MKYDRCHYEGIFVSFLRARRVPYTGIDEARRTLLPQDHPTHALKSFDYVLYGRECNYIVDLKGRRLARGSPPSWATREDIRSLLLWESLFGARFSGLLVFMYECDAQPRDGAFECVFSVGLKWYCFRAVFARDFAKDMRTRSARWETVDLAARDFERLQRPFPPRRIA